ncbi:MAG TPA: MerR family transcriptional regulator, partial [Thermoanaerobacterales bacterium]|nr:MerR family transcriptional regulator [Thermoanaerobacterales bacterium]
PQCGKLFVYSHRNLCPECLKKDEQEFDLVRDFLYDNPQASLEEISEATGISTKNILEYLKEGRLMLRNDNVNILLSCELCGEPILSGRMCEKCSGKFKREWTSHKKSMFIDEDMKGKIHLSKLSRDERRRR